MIAFYRRRVSLAGAVGFLVLLLAACQTGDVSTVGFLDPDKLREIDASVARAIEEGKTPGGVFWLERERHNYRRAYGRREVQPHSVATRLNAIYDVASLTKVVATTPCVLWLIEQGSLELDAPVGRYLREFVGEGRDSVLLRHLLTHTSGLRPGLGLKPDWTGYDKAIQLACRERPQELPGTVFRYSDVNFILLGEVIRRVGGRPLNEFAELHFYRPLGMKDTGFLPSPEKHYRIAPTERVDGHILRGVVHDPTARRMGGIAGHAGVFTTMADLARFARMMLNGGSLEGVRVLKSETVKLMTTVQSPPAISARRGLGWDIDSGYSRPRGKLFPIGSFGHTGWTGACLWMDPYSRTFWIFLSNRLHPDGQGNVLDLQANLGTLAAEAILGYDFSRFQDVPQPSRVAASGSPPGTGARIAARSMNLDVLNGIDVLKQKGYAPVKGLRLGLITNHTGTDRNRQRTIDLLFRAPGVQLKAIFSPEHGLWGNRDESIGDQVDSATGLPVYSLYGQSRQPRLEQIQELDALVFDIQDIGCRFYTYISTLGNCLEAAAKAHKKFLVLDRINPINGELVDGPVLTGKTSFVGWHPIPVRHGMTVGELARLFNAERGFNADLTIIPLEGWKREAFVDQTGLPWINPSPNMRCLNAAILYPGIGLLETTALSVGRGTDTPFEVVGAPYINDIELAGQMNRAGLPGVRFLPVRFVPSTSVYSNQVCAGVNIILTQRDQCVPIDVGLTLGRTLRQNYPAQFDLKKMNVLLGHAATLEALADGKSLPEIRRMWADELKDFGRRRQRWLLYGL